MADLLIAGAVGLLLGGGAAYAVLWGLAARGRRTGRDLIEQAREEAEKIRKEAQVQAKEELLRRREEAE